MKTREELEKMFDETFGDLWSIDFNDDGNNNTYITDDVKDFIFETILPEVLKSVIPPVERYAVEGTYGGGINEAIKYSERKAKELYSIVL